VILEIPIKRFHIDIGSKEFFKLAKMEIMDAHYYIVEKYGRREANYFDIYFLPRYHDRKSAYDEFR